MPRDHATEHADTTRTLCGRPTSALSVNNAFFTCEACKRVVRSRCERHNVTRCRVCPPDARIGAP